MRLLSFDDISFDDILLDYNISDDDIFVNDILKRVYHLKLMCGRMMLGSKAPNYDAYGLRRVASPLGFRAMHSHNPEYSCAMKSHFRKFGNQMSGSGNHLCNHASLLA